jgi:hypothetical protein
LSTSRPIFAGAHFLQGDNGRLVLFGIDQRRRAIGQLAGAMGGSQVIWKRFGILFRQSSTVTRAM